MDTPALPRLSELAKAESRRYDVYGYRFQVKSACAWAIEGIHQDFAYFRTGEVEPAYHIEMIEEAPRYEDVPACDASIYTPRNVAYRNGPRTYIDYGGRGLAIHDAAARRFEIRSMDVHLLYEAVYLFLLSQIGQYLDSRGMHRLHALSVSLHGRSILVLLPMGGGKSTLGAALLKHADVKILSDDSPFIDGQGRAHAFPLHLGLLTGGAEEIPEKHRRVVQRMEFGPKTLVSLDYYADRLADSAEPGLILLGRRTLRQDCRLEKASFWPAFRSIVSNGIIGLGLFHGLEFILESSPAELFTKFGLALSRLDVFLALMRRSEIYSVHLGRDVARNADTILDFARGKFKSGC